MAAREFVYIVQESSYGTPVSSPILGTQAIYVRLDGGNAFGMVGDPMMYEVMYGGGVAIPAITGSDQIECTGQLQTKFYASQAVFMMNWAAQRINSGQTTPWTTTEPAGDLASCTVYHAVTRSDGSIKRLAFPGVKVESWKVDCSRDSKIASLSLTLRAKKWDGNTYDSTSDPNSTVFPAPAETSYPTDPFRFIDLAGNVTIGSSRSQFSSVSLSGQNSMDARWFENRFLSLHRFMGRTITADVTALYKPSPDDLTSYQNISAQTSSIGFNNGSHSAIFGLNAQNYFKKLDKKLDLDKVYELGLNLKNYWDPVAGTDLSLTLS